MDLERLKRDKDYVLVEVKLQKSVDKTVLDKLRTKIRKEDVLTFGGRELKIIFRGIKDVKESREVVVKKVSDFFTEEKIEFSITNVE